MPATCVIGLQWGDEAKGKVVDVLTQKNEICVRYQGGANAGHTVKFGGQAFKLSLIPSGIFHHNVKSVVANGVVLDPARFLEEIEGLTSRGVQVDAENLALSNRLHVIMPWHFLEDRIMNSLCAHEPIGSTMRGIGQCYRDKVGRSMAFRLGDLYLPSFPERLKEVTQIKNQYLYGMNPDGGKEQVSYTETLEKYTAYAEKLKPMVTDTTAFLLNAVDADKNVLFEGAQGALLDIDHGTFPFVTSSNSSGVGVCAGAGIPAKFVKNVVGIMKAYTTRVGGGPFPTEQDNEIGQQIRDAGHEYGTVTKRPRRCGWFDAVAVRYTSRLSGVDTLSLMLLDVLDQMPEISICTAYEINGERTTDFPALVEDLYEVKPVYETMPGWMSDTTGCRNYSDLPDNAKRYVERLEQIVGAKVGIVSVGPDREQTIFRD